MKNRQARKGHGPGTVRSCLRRACSVSIRATSAFLVHTACARRIQRDFVELGQGQTALDDRSVVIQRRVEQRGVVGVERHDEAARGDQPPRRRSGVAIETEADIARHAAVRAGGAPQQAPPAATDPRPRQHHDRYGSEFSASSAERTPCAPSLHPRAGWRAIHARGPREKLGRTRRVGAPLAHPDQRRRRSELRVLARSPRGDFHLAGAGTLRTMSGIQRRSRPNSAFARRPALRASSRSSLDGPRRSQLRGPEDLCIANVLARERSGEPVGDERERAPPSSDNGHPRAMHA